VAKRKNDDDKPDRKKKPDLRKLYAQHRKEFTAADLQKFTEIDEGIPAEQVLAELEAIHREETQKKGN
jgi:hypothetical protein